MRMDLRLFDLSFELDLIYMGVIMNKYFSVTCSCYSIIIITQITCPQDRPLQLRLMNARLASFLESRSHVLPKKHLILSFSYIFAMSRVEQLMVVGVLVLSFQPQIHNV